MLASKLDPFLKRFEELNSLLSSSDIISDISKMTALSKEQKNLEPIVLKAKEYLKTLDSIEENKTLLNDAELGELAKEELKNLEELKPKLEEELKILLLPKDPNDERNIFLEIRAGTGGDEASLFVGDLVKAYARYAENRGYKLEIVSSSEGSVGGFKEIIMLVKGAGAFSRLKYEGGTHRVQRVPQTESQGRIHTSAITIAVMPEVDDIEIEINPNDLKIDVMRSSGHGGQSVNTTDSAVRITHLPTGIVVVNQDGKSQHKNKESAMKVLKARLYEMQESERLAQESEARKSQVGSGDRSERIRTYNFPQNRISDHRINLTLYRLDAILQDGLFDEVIEPLIAHYQAESLQEQNYSFISLENKTND
ncbi:peptide chain release factor 1 [Campylobacter coli]|nr:peptide chain release factor 1 [Campylobacter coli]EAI9866342.1 peptide chain release factor 1 [Campylobacter coli]EAL2745644.1 peptide chain release factor 1 [Campylobacter coli]EIZ8409354.1 peptide chain release factor 1 [Campylobacter coli]